MDWLRSRRVGLEPERAPSLPAHPYFPPSLVLPIFVSNDRDLTSMLLGFLGMWVVILGSAWAITSSWSPRLKSKDKLVMMWFVLCGILHCCFEGYFVLNYKTFASNQDLFAQLWKEYALSDSRYISGDPTVLCAEAITAAVLGPISLVTAICIARNSPYRHVLQMTVSLAHLYSDTLYLSTSIVDLLVRDVSYSRPEPYYFWFYFMFLNLIWVFVPARLLWQSVSRITEAFSAWDQVARMYSSRVNGTALREKKDRVKTNG